MDQRRTSIKRGNQRGTYLVIVMLTIAVIAAVVGIWKRGLRPVSPDAQRAAATADT